MKALKKEWTCLPSVLALRSLPATGVGYIPAYAVAKIWTVAAWPARCGLGGELLDHVGRNADDIRYLPVRTVVKDLNISMKQIELRFCVNDVITCGAIGSAAHKKFLPQSRTRDDDNGPMPGHVDTVTMSSSLHNRDIFVNHSGDLVSRCGDCNSSAAIAPILKRCVLVTYDFCNNNYSLKHKIETKTCLHCSPIPGQQSKWFSSGLFSLLRLTARIISTELIGSTRKPSRSFNERW